MDDTHTNAYTSEDTNSRAKKNNYAIASFQFTLYKSTFDENNEMLIKCLLWVTLIWSVVTINAIGIIIQPLKHKTKFTSSSSLSNSLIQYKDDHLKYRQIIEDYLIDIPCLRYKIENTDKKLFVIVRMKFPNIEENSYNSKGIKIQYLNMNIIHTNAQDINIIRNKNDIIEDKMRLGFELPVAHNSNNELNICFENILIDRSKLLKSLKKDESDDLIAREVELDIATFANFEEFQKLYNDYGNALVEDFQKSQVELDKLEELILSINNNLQIMVDDESIKRDLNEVIFRNTLVLQLPLMIAIFICNLFYIYKLIKHLQLKKFIS